MKKFGSVTALMEYIKEYGALTFQTEPKRLLLGRVHLFALATGDFNPHYCYPAFAEKHSYFKGKRSVSHGIGTIARAEAAGVSLLQQMLSFPFETIAHGYKSIRYLRPLYMGDLYQYEFSITSTRMKDGRCDLECHMLCRVLGKKPRIVAEADWQPAIIEHVVDWETADYFRHKGYWRNVYEVFVESRLETVVRHPLISAPLGVVGWISILTGLVGPILYLLGFHTPALDSAMQTYGQCPPM